MKTAALNNKDILSHKLRFEAEHYLMIIRSYA